MPLPEVLSEIAASGVGSKTVERMYERVTSALGPELSILREVPVEDIARAESSVLAEAIMAQSATGATHIGLRFPSRSASELIDQIEHNS